MRTPALAIALTLLIHPAAFGQSQSQVQTNPDGTVRVQLPVLTVTAQKELEDAQVAPVGVTVSQATCAGTVGMPRSSSSVAGRSSR